MFNHPQWSLTFHLDSLWFKNIILYVVQFCLCAYEFSIPCKYFVFVHRWTNVDKILEAYMIHIKVQKMKSPFKIKLSRYTNTNIKQSNGEKPSLFQS